MNWPSTYTPESIIQLWWSDSPGYPLLSGSYPGGYTPEALEIVTLVPLTRRPRIPRIASDQTCGFGPCAVWRLVELKNVLTTLDKLRGVYDYSIDQYLIDRQ